MDRLLEILGSIADTETTAYLLEQDFVLFVQECFGEVIAHLAAAHNNDVHG